MLVSDTLSRSHLSHSQPKFTEDSFIHHVHSVLSNLLISQTCLKQFQLETKNNPHFANFGHLYNPWMARKAPHTNRFTSILYPPQWHYILWRNSFEKWMNHSTHYPSSKYEIPYPTRTFSYWKLQKVCKAIIFFATNKQQNWRYD